ncbi:hypothetical protein HNR24_000968 [Nesterenkonia jeotgali]|uniref:CHRD domain-containing protein n=1 Tax=Nesterenkonia jeotgali TaxID=317018 RepID=A0A839FNM1_9MICC|nr:hypothetical protein [Nesterenkonia jeotgali]MBA8921035.1 hypothetical protein [Nesterenkonia jeotgali]
MRTSKFFAVPTLALGAMLLSAGPAMAHSGHGPETDGATTADSSQSWSFQTSLDPLNNSGTVGDVLIEGQGNQATVYMTVDGAAETFMDGPFPHAQHIHFGAQGLCPPADADQNGDGAVNVEEGAPFYGGIGTSLTTEGDTSADSGLAVERFPGGSSYTYERSLEIPDDVLASIVDGTGVVVVHGVDPTLLTEEAANAPSELDESLPLAATLPAACGTLTASQMDGMPEGGADTGVAAGSEGAGMALAAGGGALALGAIGAGAYIMRKRPTES